MLAPEGAWRVLAPEGAWRWPHDCLAQRDVGPGTASGVRSEGARAASGRQQADVVTHAR